MCGLGKAAPASSSTPSTCISLTSLSGTPVCTLEADDLSPLGQREGTSPGTARGRQPRSSVHRVLTSSRELSTAEGMRREVSVRQASRILEISAGLLGLKSHRAYTAASWIPHGMSEKNFHISHHTRKSSLCKTFMLLI